MSQIIFGRGVVIHCSVYLNPPAHISLLSFTMAVILSGEIPIFERGAWLWVNSLLSTIPAESRLAFSSSLYVVKQVSG